MCLYSFLLSHHSLLSYLFNLILNSFRVKSRSLYYIEVIQPMAQRDNLYRRSSGIHVVRIAVPARSTVLM